MKYILSFIMIFLAENLSSQTITISGYVSDNYTHEKLIGAYIYYDNNNVVVTNNFGFYSISLPKDKKIILHYKYLGYKTDTVMLLSAKNTYKNIYLSPNNNIDKVTVIASDKNIFSNYSLKPQNTKLLPGLTGEKDALKSLQMLPGVQFGNEGSSDLFVRGGTPDQNLILIDDMPLHFTNHLGGFVSIFDNNAINSIKLFRAGIPAKYGGHLSAVLDIRLKDGNMNKLEGEFSLGLVSSKISLSGPIIKNKLSFIFTFRKSNFELLSAAFYFAYPQDKTVNIYSFFDLNTKINYKISDKDKIDITFYTGRDINKFKNTDSLQNTNLFDTKYKYVTNNTWGNYLNAFRWTHRYNNKLFQKISLGFIQYNYKKQELYNETYKDTSINYGNTKYISQVQDIILKTDYDYHITNNNSLNFGLYTEYNIYNPGNFFIKTYSINTDTITGYKQEKTLKPYDFNLYIQDTWKLNKLSVNTGILANIYFLNNNIWKNLQPRIKLTFQLLKNTVINCSYDRTVQNLHILTKSNAMIPSDIWVPATNIANPEKGNQYSLGISQNIFNNKIVISTSLFYKTASNLIDYQQYTFVNDTVKNQSWEYQIATNGSANIYGLEFLIQKTSNKLNYWISYTYMKNYRTFKDLNDGKPFPFTFDRRHSLQISIIYKLNKNISFSSSFSYGSGYPINLPIIKLNIINNNEGMPPHGNAMDYLIDKDTYYQSQTDYSQTTAIYSKLNSYRMPDFHTLNIAFNWSKQKKYGKRTWSFNIYNVYNRQNAYFLFIQKERDNSFSLYKYTLFPIIPSVSYSYKF